MKTQLQKYAEAARYALAIARQYRDSPHYAAIYRANAREYIAQGKRYRSIKRQADMWGQLFDSFTGGRR